jgi:hypothetical protein
MPTNDYRFHSGARMALNVAGVLCLITIVGIPFGIWILMRVAGARVTLHDGGLEARALGTTRVDYADVTRFGVLRVPIIARGIGGALARKKVGGDEGVNLCFQTRAGKTKKFIVSQYENWEELVAEVGRRVQKKPEELKMGVWGPKWPELAA